MKITVDIPDAIIAEAVAAAKRIDARQPETQRQIAPLVFTMAEASDIIYQWLQNLIVSDLQQQQQSDAERVVRTKLAALAAVRTTTAPTP